MAHWQPAFDPQASESDDNLKTHAVHMALLPHGPLGTILFFSGNKWDGANHNSGNVDHTAVMDYQSRAASRPGSPAGPGGLPPGQTYDLFCSGHALLADGRLLVGGGTSLMGIPDPVNNPHHGHWGGLRESFAFNAAATQAWCQLALMNPEPGANGNGGGRWYPSLVTLADGSVLALCGHPRVFPHKYDEAVVTDSYPPLIEEEDDRHNNVTPDRFRPCINCWHQLSAPDGIGETGHDFAVFYPRVHVVPGGKVLIVQPLYTLPPLSVDPSGTYAGKSLIYDADSQTIAHAFKGPQAIDGIYLVSDTGAQDTTSVLLPLLPETGYKADILVCGGTKAVRATFAAGAEASAQWIPTSDRPAFFVEDGSKITPSRPNATVAPYRRHSIATLLPTGQVLVTGGIHDYGQLAPGQGYDDAFGVRVPELFDPQTGAWTALTAAPAQVSRGYHSTALLMLDGRVVTAGSERDNIFGAPSAETRMEPFEPDYIAAPHRPSLVSAPPSASYGESFRIHYALAAGTAHPNISRVVLIRFGSVTHGFDYDQRYVGLEFTAPVPGELRATAPPDPSLAPPGYYMLWLLDSGGFPCVRAGMLRLGQQALSLQFDRSVFSIYDVLFNRDPGSQTTRYERAFFAVFDGFVANEILTLNPTVTVSGPGITATLSSALGIPNPALELPGSPELIQRSFFGFDLVFTGDAVFAGMIPDDMRTVTLTLSAGPWTATGTIELAMEPSPFMLDGQPFYLSQDLRVFQVTETTAQTWVTEHDWAGPIDFINILLERMNKGSALETGIFGIIPPLGPTPLMLLPTTDGTPQGERIYNFAVARVRLDSAAVPASGVRVMFRLFRTMTPSLTYDPATHYRRQVDGLDAIPLLGSEGSELRAIPFFAHDRVASAGDMTTQADPANRLDMPAGATEQRRFFGCWLDVNQPDDKRFPSQPGNATSFAGVPPNSLRSIQELITGTHQCLVAEVHYKLDAAAPDLPQGGQSPSTSDKLAQRNLALVLSANPGTAATRTVQHSFEIKANPAPKSNASGRYRRSEHAAEGLALWWGTLPPGSEVEIFLPDVLADDLLAQTPPTYAPRWRKVDDHCVACAELGDLAFLTFPQAAPKKSLKGLMTVRLPAGVRHGEVYRVIGQQFSRSARIAGSFEVRILVDADHDGLLARDRDEYAIFSHSLKHLPSNDPWRPVLARMLSQLRERLVAFDSDPAEVAASPWGAGPHRPVAVGEGPFGSAEACGRHDGDLVIARFCGEAEVPVGVEVDVKLDVRLSVRSKRKPPAP